MSPYFLLHVYPVILVGVFVVWATLASLNANSLAAPFKTLVSKRGSAAALLLALAFLVVRIAVVPPRHQVYFDEFLHENIASNIARYGVFGESVAGGEEGLNEFRVPAWPAGQHVLLASVFRVFGYSETAAFRFGAVCGAGSVLLIFLLAALLFKSEAAGLCAALFLSALPLHFRFSGATDLTACSEFWILTSLLTLALHLELQVLPSYVLMLLSLVYACHVRVENLLLVPFAAAVLMLSRRKPRSGPKDGSLVASSIALLLLAPLAALLLTNRDAGLAGYSNSMLEMLGNEVRNGIANAMYFLATPAVTFLLLPLAAAGLVRLPAPQRARSLSLLLLGAAYAALCSMHVMASFRDGIFDHLALPTFLCIVLAAAGGLASMRIRRFQPALIALVMLAFIGMNKSAYGKGPLARYENEYRLVQGAQALLPPDAVVLTFCPPLILAVADRKALSPFALTGNSFDLETRLGAWDSERVIVFKDVWWYKFSEASSAVEKILRLKYRFQPIVTAQIDSKEYGFYRLVPLGNPARKR